MQKFEDLIKNFLDNLMVSILALILFVIPLISDRSNLPFGWDIPKVIFFQWTSILFIFLSLGFIGFKVYTKQIRKRNLAISAGLVFLGISLISISSLFLPYELFDPNIYQNSFYSFFEKVLFFLPESRIGIWGNSFRHIGLITVILLIMFGWCARYFINKKNINLIFLSLILGSLVQSIIAFEQYIDLYQNSPDRLTQGLFIYGTFGQTNFYAGMLLIGGSLATYYLKSKYYMFSIISIFLIITGIFISFSSWAIFLVFFAIVTYFLFEYTPQKQKFKNILIYLTLIFVSTFLVIFTYDRLVEEKDFRIFIWSNVIDTFVSPIFEDPLDLSHWRHLLFGGGFDNLAEFIYRENRFTESYLDRPHNFFLYSLTSAGLIGLSLLSIVLAKLVYILKTNIDNKVFMTSFFVLLIWLARSFVHTSSIINYLHLVVIIATLFAIQKNTSPKNN